jgi:hypothetical protein
MHKITLAALILFAGLTRALAVDPPTLDYTPDVIYGRSYSTALTMEVHPPKIASNHIAVITVVSGGWVSSARPSDMPIAGSLIAPFTSRGFTVFAVSHGSHAWACLSRR